MHNSDSTLVQDTSTQAMTEVALGLSMAFFALLIIALMSVSLPSSVNEIAKSTSDNFKQQLEIAKKVNLSLEDSSAQEKPIDKATISNTEEVILLYWEGQFFDTQHQIVNLEELTITNNIIVAVSSEIPFNQLINIQTQFAGNTLRLTQLSEQWHRAFTDTIPNKYFLNNAPRVNE